MKLAQDNTISCANFILHFKDIMISPTKSQGLVARICQGYSLALVIC